MWEIAEDEMSVASSTTGSKKLKHKQQQQQEAASLTNFLIKPSLNARQRRPPQSSDKNSPNSASNKILKNPSWSPSDLKSSQDDEAEEKKQEDPYDQYAAPPRDEGEEIYLESDDESAAAPPAVTGLATKALVKPTLRARWRPQTKNVKTQKTTLVPVQSKTVDPPKAAAVDPPQQSLPPKEEKQQQEEEEDMPTIHLPPHLRKQQKQPPQVETETEKEDVYHEADTPETLDLTMLDESLENHGENAAIETQMTRQETSIEIRSSQTLVSAIDTPAADQVLKRPTQVVPTQDGNLEVAAVAVMTTQEEEEEAPTPTLPMEKKVPENNNPGKVADAKMPSDQKETRKALPVAPAPAPTLSTRTLSSRSSQSQKKAPVVVMENQKMVQRPRTKEDELAVVASSSVTTREESLSKPEKEKSPEKAAPTESFQKEKVPEEITPGDETAPVVAAVEELQEDTVQNKRVGAILSRISTDPETKGETIPANVTEESDLLKKILSKDPTAVKSASSPKTTSNKNKMEKKTSGLIPKIEEEELLDESMVSFDDGEEEALHNREQAVEVTTSDNSNNKKARRPFLFGNKAAASAAPNAVIVGSAAATPPPAPSPASPSGKKTVPTKTAGSFVIKKKKQPVVTKNNDKKVGDASPPGKENATNPDNAEAEQSTAAAIFGAGANMMTSDVLRMTRSWSQPQFFENSKEDEVPVEKNEDETIAGQSTAVVIAPAAKASPAPSPKAKGKAPVTAIAVASASAKNNDKKKKKKGGSVLKSIRKAFSKDGTKKKERKKKVVRTLPQDRSRSFHSQVSGYANIEEEEEDDDESYSEGSDTESSYDDENATLATDPGAFSPAVVVESLERVFTCGGAPSCSYYMHQQEIEEEIRERRAAKRSQYRRTKSSGDLYASFLGEADGASYVSELSEEEGAARSARKARRVRSAVFK